MIISIISLVVLEGSQSVCIEDSAVDLVIACWPVWKDGFLTLRPDVYSVQLSDCGTPFGSRSPVLRLRGSRLGHLAEAVTIVPHPSVDIV